MKLRPYQSTAVSNLRASFRKGNRAIILVAPTGAGKTVMACSIIEGAVSKGSSVLFLAHRKELIDQASARLRAWSVKHAFVAAGYPSNPESAVQIASVQTIVRRKEIPPAKLVIVDECHHATAGSYQKILERYPDAVVIGLTATAFRSDGSGLGDSFQDAVIAATPEELTKQGFLVPARYWAPSLPDLKGISRSGGDLDPEQSRQRMSKVTGDVVKHYLKLARGKRAIVFACNVEHSKELAMAFHTNGIRAEHLDGTTKRDSRTAILRDFSQGKVEVVVNCSILSEGYDCPAAEVIILDRPTTSLGLHTQQIGRGLRPHPGKAECMVFDHAGNTLRHGMVADVTVDLSTGVPTARRESVPALRSCVKCFAILPGSAKECPACGAKLTPKIQKIRATDGALIEQKGCSCGSFATESIQDPEKGTKVSCSGCGKHIRWIGNPGQDPGEYFRKKLKECQDKGWRPGRAAVMFKARYGHWPSKGDKE